MITESEEVKIFLKTKKELFNQVEDCIEQNSSYEISEILQIPIERASTNYLQWMEKVLAKKEL